MKNLKCLFAFSLLSLILFADLTFAQSTNVTLQRTISLPGDSKTEEIIVNVDEKLIYLLELSIKSTVSLGKLSIEIYDPKGEKHGNFTVGNQLNSENTISIKKQEGVTSGKSEIVNGTINKIIREPMIGNWIIKIIPNKARGRINIQSNYLYGDSQSSK